METSRDGMYILKFTIDLLLVYICVLECIQLVHMGGIEIKLVVGTFTLCNHLTLCLVSM